MGKLYDALIACNVPDDKARAAAEEAASYKNRMFGIETQLTLTWMLGINVALTLVLFIKVFLVH
jgi:hypothetical protein